MNIRIGEGWDVHALVEGRPLILGGVRIPHDKGLLGHSDADALLHAITDALFGAAGLGDIGRHFPDTDEAFRGADSAVLLAEAVRRVAAAGWRIVNVDSTIVAQAPKLAPHIESIRARVAEVLGVAAAGAVSPPSWKSSRCWPFWWSSHSWISSRILAFRSSRHFVTILTCFSSRLISRAISRVSRAPATEISLSSSPHRISVGVLIPARSCTVKVLRGVANRSAVAARLPG